MVPLKQGNRGVRDVQEERGGVIWYPTWNTYKKMVVPPTIVSGGAVCNQWGKEVG